MKMYFLKNVINNAVFSSLAGHSRKGGNPVWMPAYTGMIRYHFQINSAFLISSRIKISF